MAATDAAVHPWPLITLDHLLKYMAEHYRIELLQLLHKPLLKALQSSSVLQQQQQTAATVAILECIKSEAVTDAPELLGDVLLLLAQQVSMWVDMCAKSDVFISIRSFDYA